jgi:hypothetical protein
MKLKLALGKPGMVSAIVLAAHPEAAFAQHYILGRAPDLRRRYFSARASRENRTDCLAR